MKMSNQLIGQMRVAGEALKRRTSRSGNAHGSGPASVLGCVAKLDRLQGYSIQNPSRQVQANPDIKSLTAHRVARPRGGRFQAYGRVHWFRSTTSCMKVLIESERREAWLPRYRVTLYADDNTGLLPDEVFGILEVLGDFRMTIIR
jgi:hypothetical protein